MERVGKELGSRKEFGKELGKSSQNSFPPLNNCIFGVPNAPQQGPRKDPADSNKDPTRIPQETQQGSRKKPADSNKDPTRISQETQQGSRKKPNNDPTRVQQNPTRAQQGPTRIQQVFSFSLLGPLLNFLDFRRFLASQLFLLLGFASFKSS